MNKDDLSLSLSLSLSHTHRALVGKSEGKRSLGRPRRTWEDGIRMDIRDNGWGVWIGFDWLRTGTGGELL
jgi:hypothetical protein